MPKSDRCLLCKQPFYSDQLKPRDLHRSVEPSDVPWYCETCVQQSKVQEEVLMYRHQVDQDEAGYAFHDSDEVNSE